MTLPFWSRLASSTTTADRFSGVGAIIARTGQFKRVKGRVARVVACERRQAQFGQVQLTSEEIPLPPHELNPSTQTEPPMHAQVTRPAHAAGTVTQW
jgi:hypothetical protein